MTIWKASPSVMIGLRWLMLRLLASKAQRSGASMAKTGPETLCCGAQSVKLMKFNHCGRWAPSGGGGGAPHAGLPPGLTDIWTGTKRFAGGPWHGTSSGGPEVAIQPKEEEQPGSLGLVSPFPTVSLALRIC